MGVILAEITQYPCNLVASPLWGVILKWFKQALSHELVASPLWGLFQTELDLDDNSDDSKQVELFDEKGGA